MATWNVLVNSGGTLTASSTDVMKPPPKVLDRLKEGAPGRSVAKSLTGRVIVSEVTKTQTIGTLRLRWEYLSATDAATLRAILSYAGTVAVTLYSGGATITCIPGPDTEQQWETGIGDDWPEKLASGSDQPAARTWWRAEITLYRIA